MLAKLLQKITNFLFGPITPVVYVDEATVRRLEKLAEEQNGLK